MAASITITDADNIGKGGLVRKVTLAWTSHTDGTVSGIPTGTLSGTLGRVIFSPGTPAPTNNYDVTLLDSFAIDVLAGQGANLSNTTNTTVCPGVPLKDGTTTDTIPFLINDTLSLTISGAGNSAQGTVVLLLR